MTKKYAKIVDGLVSTIILTSKENLNALNTGDLWVDVTNFPYSGIGDVYEYNDISETYIVHAQQPHSSWALNKDTCLWESPVAYPTDGNKCIWNEDTLAWDEFVIPT
jgi:hypothetical protein